MNVTKNRSYVSPKRAKQAAATRSRIIDVAENLLEQKGFTGMTVAEVAELAGISAQSVYAIFSSKAGIIMAAIEDRVLHDERNIDALKVLESTANPVLILQSAAKVVRNIYEGNSPTFSSIYGAGMMSPKLAELEKELADLRLEKQAPLVKNLVASGKLLPLLDEEAVRDILWALTSREMYSLLVIRRGWTLDRYEKQLAFMLISSLVPPELAASPKTTP